MCTLQDIHEFLDLSPQPPTLGVSLRVPYCVVDAGYGLGRSLGDCRPALPKGQNYQMVKT